MSGVAPTQRGAACRFDADCQHLTTTPRCFFAPGDPDGQCVAANRVNPTPSGTPAPGNSGNSKSDSGSNGGTNITAVSLSLIRYAVGSTCETFSHLTLAPDRCRCSRWFGSHSFSSRAMVCQKETAWPICIKRPGNEKRQKQRQRGRRNPANDQSTF